MRMAMGRQESQQETMWIAAQALPRSPGHVFYDKLNGVLEVGGFDRFVEELCAPHYAADVGRPSIPPGVYFRMLFVGYFEGLESQRAIAWRCADSLSLRTFLRVEVTKGTPDHSSMTNTRKRLPEDVFWQVFAFVLKVAVEHKLLKGKTIAVDSTTLEANAAMKSLVRRATNEDWKTYVKRLMRAEGIDDPSDEEVRRFDRKRKKKTSNKEWKSATDPDSRVTKMKDGRTHLAYKAEHAVELGSGLIVVPVVYRGDDGDAETLPVTVELAREQLQEAGSPHQVDEIVGDKGYHKAETIQTLEEVEQVRTYIAEPKRRGRRRWLDKPEGQQHAVYANRQRIKGDRGRRLGRQRSEQAERSFAHTCETGGGRRAWVRGVVNVSKHHVMRAAACNLGIIMLALFGVGTPRTLQGGMGILFVALSWLVWRRYSLRADSYTSRANDASSTPPTAPPTSATLAAA
ncbi:MAG: transposase [Candidatus Eiseniibacteriota bacterium]